jgi:hypothetical protein
MRNSNYEFKFMPKFLVLMFAWPALCQNKALLMCHSSLAKQKNIKPFSLRAKHNSCSPAQSFCVHIDLDFKVSARCKLHRDIHYRPKEINWNSVLFAARLMHMGADQRAAAIGYTLMTMGMSSRWPLRDGLMPCVL